MRFFSFILILPLFLLTFGQPAGESKAASDVSKTARLAISKIPNKLTTYKPPVKQKTKQKQAIPSTQSKKIHTKTSKQKTSTKEQANTNNSTSTKQPSTSNPSNTDSSILPVEKEVVRLVNIERSKKGLKPLEMDSKLSMVARKKSSDMKENNYFSHESPTYGSPFDMLKHFGVSYQTAGENIAAGYPTAEAVVKGWMNSEGHRKNILNASFTHIGVGFVSGGSYGNYWTQLFTG